MSRFPFVSILVVNYNGRNLLKECLSALLKVNYPRNFFEVIVVDNNSNDNSVYFIKKHFPKVKLVESNQNLGFSGGNRLGLNKAKGDYIVLLNSDVRVEKNWLRALVSAAQPDKIGMVSSKLYFATPFLELKIKSKVIPKSDLTQQIDYSPIGVIVEDVVCRNENLSKLVWYDSGFYEKKEGNITTRWTSGEGTVLIPFASARKENYTLKIHGYPHRQDLSTPITVSAVGRELIKDQLKANEVKQYKFTLDKSKVKSHFIWLVQNAGNQLLHDGHGKDRGSLIRRVGKHNLEFYDRDGQYFNNKADLLAICGASCLIKREVIDDVGFLDDYYFMYYEDLDLSFRAWKQGWDVVYSPESIGYHRHRATTNDGDNAFFKTLIERNHLYFTLTHYPLITFVKQLSSYMLSLLVAITMFNVLRFVDNVYAYKKWSVLAENKINCTKQLLCHIRQLLHNRYYWKNLEKRSFWQARKMMY